MARQPRMDDPGTWGRKTVRVRRSDGSHQVCKDARAVPLSFGLIVWYATAGIMLYFRHLHKNWVAMTKKGVFAVYRAMCHILDNQIEEIPTIEQVRDAIRDLPIELKLTEARQLIEAGVLDLRRTLYEQLDKLGSVINPDKLKARRQMRMMILVTDSMGRLNIGVLLCRQVSAIDKLEERIESLKRMHLRVQYKRQVLIMLIGACETTLENIRALYATLSHVVTNISESQSDRNREANEREFNRLSTRVELELRKLTLQPYLRTARHLTREITQIRSEVKAGFFSRALKIVERGRASIALKQIQRPLELAILHVQRAADNGGNMDEELRDRLIAGLSRVITILKNIYDDDFERRVRRKSLPHVLRVLSLLQLPKPLYDEIRQEIDLALESI